MRDNSQKRWKSAFYMDGSYRDIYVLRTNEQDWQQLLTFLHTNSYSLEFFVDGEQQPLPHSVEDIFSSTHEHSYVLYVDLDGAGLRVKSHFFTSEAIEFNLDPSVVESEPQVSHLLDFLREIGRLLNKTVIMTVQLGSEPENDKGSLFRFDPVTGKEEWNLEGLAEEGEWADPMK